MKKPYVIVSWLVGLFVLSIIMRQQSISLDEMGSRRAAEQVRHSDVVLVGVSWPTSVLKDDMLDGMKLALDEINSGNLAGGYKIRLDIRDDGLDRGRAKSIAMDFADNPEMSAVIGYNDDGIGIAVSPIFEESRLFHLILGAHSTQMTSYGFKYIARTVLSTDKIAVQLARFAIAHGYKKITVIMEEDYCGEELVYQFVSCLDKESIRPVSYYFYPREMPDFNLTANELKTMDTDFIFFAGLDAAAISFTGKVRKLGLKTPILWAFGDNSALLQRQAGGLLDNSMILDYYNVSADNPENKAFVKKFMIRYGRHPQTWAAQAYDALHILARALRITRSRNSLDLSYAVRYMDEWYGANGRYKFDQTGNLENKPLWIYRFRGGAVLMN